MTTERVEAKGKQEQWNTGGHTKKGRRREQWERRGKKRNVFDMNLGHIWFGLFEEKNLII